MKNIFIMIMQHVDFLDKSLMLTKKLLQYSVKNDIVKLNQGLENRQRLIDIIGTYQNQIESLLLQKKEVDPFTKEILDAWNYDINMMMTKLSKIDQIITDILSKQKSQITNQIALSHKQQNMLSGYNLRSTK